MILRQVLLYLSRWRSIERWLVRLRVTRRVVKRFVAGETIEAGLAAARQLQHSGILATLDHLGEFVNTADEAEAAGRSARAALARIREDNLDATFSIKLSQFGLALDETLCRRLVASLAEAARAMDMRIEIDMESSAHTENTVLIARDLHARYGNVRLAIQAYLRRTERDIETLCREGVPVRLCKGAYQEPASVAFQSRKDVDASYLRLVGLLLERGDRPAFATHDRVMVQAVLSGLERRGLTGQAIEFQMLYGVRGDLQRELARDGRRLRLYVPYGEAWYPYFARRLAERPANVLFLARALVGR